MRVAICHTDISGYMAAAWRALVAARGCELLIIARQPNPEMCAKFEVGLLEGLPCKLLPPREFEDEDAVRALVTAHRPDIVVVPGWANPAFVDLAYRPELSGARFVLGMDTPLRRDSRQFAAKWRMRRYMSRIDRVVVAGERAFQYACYLGVPERKIRRGWYCLDYPAFGGHYAQRTALPDGWPKRFLYVGRYVDAKAIDVLLEGYAIYRRSASDPWPLSCCGTGPWAQRIGAADGVKDLGFVQPGEHGSIYVNHGVFVIASRYEPWGVVLAEAAASGLPIIHSEACGAGVEVVRYAYNGLSFATGDAEALSGAMRWMHMHYDRLPEMGRRGMELARPFSAEMWAERWSEIFAELAGAR